MRNIYNNYQKYILENLMTLLFSSFFIASSFELIVNEYKFLNLKYVASTNIFLFFLVGFLAFIGTIFIGKKEAMKERSSWVLLSSVIYFSLLTIFKHPESLYFTLGIIILNAIVIYFVASEDRLNLKKIKISNKTLITSISLGFLVCIYLVASYTIKRYHSFGASTFDFGIFAQMFEYMAKTGVPLTTLERDGLLSHFAVHFSPIYYLFLPGYLIFRCPEYLLGIQAIFIFSGVFPIYLLCRHKKINNFYILLISFTYLFYPALTAGAFFDFHENKFLTVLILWMVYFLEKNKNIPMLVFMFLVLMVKEDSALYIIFIGLYKLFYNKDYRNGGKILITGIIYFIIAISVISFFGGVIMSDRFNNYFSSSNGGLISMFKTIFLNFGFLIYQIMTIKKIDFILWMFLPVAFIPFINKKISNLILLIPLLVINLMPNYPYQYNVNFQYTYGVVALIFYGLIVNISESNNKLKRTMLLLAVVSSLYCSVSLNYTKFELYEIKDYENQEKTRKCLDKIPMNAEVTSATYFTSYLYKRDIVYMYPSKHQTKYMIIDLRDDNTLILTQLKNTGYEKVYECGYAGIYRALKE